MFSRSCKRHTAVKILESWGFPSKSVWRPNILWNCQKLLQMLKKKVVKVTATKMSRNNFWIEHFEKIFFKSERFSVGKNVKKQPWNSRLVPRFSTRFQTYTRLCIPRDVPTEIFPWDIQNQWSIEQDSFTTPTTSGSFVCTYLTHWQSRKRSLHHQLRL